MAVTFTAWDYMGELVLLAFGALALVLLVGLPLVFLLARKTKNPAIGLLPMVVLLPLYVLLASHVIPAGERTGCLYPRENAYTHTTAGTITDVRPADHIPLYYHDGEFRGGVYVTMDGTEYYSMAHPLLTAGTSLHFTYCPEEDLIMAFSPIEGTEVASLQTPFVMPEPLPPEPVPQLQVRIGTILTWIGFGGIALLVFFQNRLSLHYAVDLLERDSHQRGEVIPNPAASTTAIVLLPVCVAALGGAIASNAWGLLFPLALAVPAMLLLPRLTAWHVRLEGRNIRIRRFGREQTVPLSTLRSVYWRQVKWDPFKRSFSQRKLILVFDSWTLELDQDSHLGLNDLHRRLSALLKISH